jgi:hypothetical protein
MTDEQFHKQDLTVKAVRYLEEINTYSTFLQFGMTPESVINWVGESKDDHPTQVEIDAKVTELETEYATQEYSRNRKIEYDALNQLEMQFDDKEDGTTTWEDAIVAIKTKYPKG